MIQRRFKNIRTKRCWCSDKKKKKKKGKQTPSSWQADSYKYIRFLLNDINHRRGVRTCWRELFRLVCSDRTDGQRKKTSWEMGIDYNPHPVIGIFVMQGKGDTTECHRSRRFPLNRPDQLWWRVKPLPLTAAQASLSESRTGKIIGLGLAFPWLSCSDGKSGKGLNLCSPLWHTWTFTPTSSVQAFLQNSSRPLMVELENRNKRGRN